PVTLVAHPVCFPARPERAQLRFTSQATHIPSSPKHILSKRQFFELFQRQQGSDR
ncbi:hypothetical protein H0H93_007296, partial [Arthromyces matolae]